MNNAPSPSGTALVSVCMRCKRHIGTGHRPTGPALPSAPGQSHGICLTCFPAYAKSLNLTEAQQQRILAHAHD